MEFLRSTQLIGDLLQHVGAHHGRLQIAVPEQKLNSSYICCRVNRVGREVGAYHYS